GRPPSVPAAGTTGHGDHHGRGADADDHHARARADAHRCEDQARRRTRAVLDRRPPRLANRPRDLHRNATAAPDRSLRRAASLDPDGRAMEPRRAAQRQDSPAGTDGGERPRHRHKPYAGAVEIIFATKTRKPLSLGQLHGPELRADERGALATYRLKL